MMLASPSADVFQARVLRWLQGLQYPLLLLFFHMVPPPFVDPQHRFNETYPTLLVVTLSACIAVAGWTLWRRFGTDGPGPPERHPPPPPRPRPGPGGRGGRAAVRLLQRAALAVGQHRRLPLGRAGPALAPAGRVPQDPVRRLRAHPRPDGVRPRGLFGSLFFDGTAATSPKAVRAAHRPGRGHAGPGPTSPGRRARWGPWSCSAALLPAAGPRLLLHPRVPRPGRPGRWSATAGAAAGRLARASRSCSWATTRPRGRRSPWPRCRSGCGPAWRACRTRRAALAGVVVAVAAVACRSVTLAVPLARHVCGAFVAFVADNAYTNDVAHDIPWADGAAHRVDRLRPGPHPVPLGADPLVLVPRRARPARPCSGTGPPPAPPARAGPATPTAPRS